MGAILRRAAMSAAFCLLTGAASAAPAVHQAISPLEVLKILKAEDASFRLNDSNGDTTVTGAVDGQAFDIYFYGCDGDGFVAPARPDSACLGIEFRAYFDGYPSDAEIVNAWNNAHHYGALWRDDDEDLALQLNVIVEGGVTSDNIIANYRWWRRVMRSLDDFLAE